MPQGLSVCIRSSSGIILRPCSKWAGKADLLGLHRHVDVFEVAQAQSQIDQVQIVNDVQRLAAYLPLLLRQPQVCAVPVRLRNEALFRVGASPGAYRPGCSTALPARQLRLLLTALQAASAMQLCRAGKAVVSEQLQKKCLQ